MKRLSSKARRDRSRQNFFEYLTVEVVLLRMAGCPTEELKAFENPKHRDREVLKSKLNRLKAYVVDGKYVYSNRVFNYGMQPSQRTHPIGG
jgi:hypothetical protein